MPPLQIEMGVPARVLPSGVVPHSRGKGRHGGARRLYVEAFATKAGAEKLREDVTAELRKLTSVSLVSRRIKGAT
jgi:hypothetical protein